MGQPHLSSHHRRTLQKILDHPVSHNIEWHDVLSLLAEVGTVDERHDGKIRLAIGSASEVIEIPVTKDLDTETVVQLRRILTQAGYGKS
ncbi:hypothetical protein Ais01nite_14650 [Asanoa ishikariensis]|uniref:HicA toxin of toxin-antitoxin n=1 Tax=Asanoa ishikariensis TaxID=137265 RepID=A0A1H3UJQ1_9ACTN|nr:hypothetical protein [Asanoa ishikariensis]GIF63430.1 hypothetical protein Ais01nite_14650 [Asanoa ishikariensis]SDZ62231.1 hypothetical protein SAMN05421684_7408 [Asanoa ishikariensis]